MVLRRCARDDVLAVVCVHPRWAVIGASELRCASICDRGRDRADYTNVINVARELVDGKSAVRATLGGSHQNMVHVADGLPPGPTDESERRHRCGHVVLAQYQRRDDILLLLLSAPSVGAVRIALRGLGTDSWLQHHSAERRARVDARCEALVVGARREVLDNRLGDEVRRLERLEIWKCIRPQERVARRRELGREVLGAGRELPVCQVDADVVGDVVPAEERTRTEQVVSASGLICELGKHAQRYGHPSASHERHSIAGHIGG
jgi:hypothetical protein